ncbi:MAG: RICIN domain-containing protein [Lachnospiraceae bacterium]|nr:RICIN domain-containing protein [Lachnospiraceae bacterium]
MKKERRRVFKRYAVLLLTLITVLSSIPVANIPVYAAAVDTVVSEDIVTPSEETPEIAETVSDDTDSDDKEDSEDENTVSDNETDEDENTVSDNEADKSEDTVSDNEADESSEYDILYDDALMAAGSDDYPSKYKNAGKDSIIDEWRFYNRECTSFVAWRLNSVNGVGFHNTYKCSGSLKWGDAKNWKTTAQKVGFKVDMNPAPGSVYWKNGGTWGHVAWVLSVDNNSKKVTIEEYNWDSKFSGTYRKTTKNISDADGYIHIKDISPTGVRHATGHGQKIPDGNYRIVCGTSMWDCYTPDQWSALDIAGTASTCANGTNVQLCRNMTHANDVFTVTYLNNGFYKITQKGTNMALEVKGASMYEEANVQMGTYNSSNEAQMWCIEEAPDISGRGTGFYALRARNNSFVLDIVGGDNGAPDDGKNAQVYTWHDSKNQKWKFIPVASDSIAEGDYHIVSDLNKSMGLGTVQGSSVDPNYPTAVLTNNILNNNNIFTFTKQGSHYCIQQKSTGYYLDAEGGGTIKNAGYWPRPIADTPATCQIWALKSTGSGSYYISSMYNGAYLDVVDGKTNNNQNVWLHWGNMMDAQKWTLLKVVKGISLDQSDLELEVNTTKTLTPVFTPSDAGIKTVEWSSTNTSVATVNNGTVKAIAPGTATITVKSKDGGFTANCRITVKAKPTSAPSPTAKPNPTTTPKPTVAPKPSPIPTVKPSPTVKPDPTSAPTQSPQKPKDLSIENVKDMTYTGTKIIQNIRVYFGETLLKEGTEYSVTYKNNIKVGTATITVTGKGNYIGKVTEDFSILQADVSKAAVIVNAANENGMVPTPKVKVSYYGKNLVQNKDFRVDVDWDHCETQPENGVDIKVYPIKVVGIGKNFTGTNTTGRFKVYPKGQKAITDNKYIDLKKGSAKLTRTTYFYTGNELIPQFNVYTEKNGNGDIIDPSKYAVSYSTNVNKGSAGVTITGIESKGVMGSLTLKYTISSKNIGDKEITVTMPSEKDIVYAKGGSKPVPKVSFKCADGSIRELREGVDYTLSYANNTVYNGSKPPTVTIKGTGNFNGSVTRTYIIKQQNIANTKVVTTDKAAKVNAKGTYFISKPKVYDLDGKLLAENKDYIVRYINTADGREVDKNTLIYGTGTIRIVVNGINQYYGSTEATYQVRTLLDLGKVKADKISDQQYTGRAIRPDVELALYTSTGSGSNIRKSYLSYGKDYEIVVCYNNVKKGTATYVLKGKGAYSGTKTVTFKIKQAVFRKR